MRVITGSAKGRRLESAPEGTRPITDRAKEALFSILGPGIVGTRVLDLFGGTGAVGIEALSRGASEAIFVEQSPAALKVIGHNLQSTGLAARAHVVRGDAFKYLERPAARPFGVIFVAPPQYEGLWLRALLAIDAHPELLTPTGLVVVQIHPKEFTEPALARLSHTDTRRYGSVRLDFYTPTPA